MKVNYKFQILVKVSELTVYLDRSIDIEISTLNQLYDSSAVRDMISDIKGIYFSYYGYTEDILANSLDYADLSFLLFLKDIGFANFDNVKFEGDFLPLVGRHGKFFDFVLYVNEG